MVCHQRTGLPNTRFINKAEALGLTCERLPGGRRRDMNWAHFAEWTCRDQLRQIQSERDSKEGLGAVHIKSEGVQGGDEDQRHDQDNDNLQQRHQGFRKMLTSQSREQVEASMAAWRLHLASLENKMPSMEVLVNSLSKKQAASDLELVRVESQLVDRRQLVTSATRKLTILQLDVDAQKGRMLQLRSQCRVLDAQLVECVLALECLERKVDSQLGMVEVFSDLLADGEKSYSTASASLSVDKAAWESVVQKLETMRAHKSALST
jgi:chromosome segregation ATPase